MPRPPSILTIAELIAERDRLRTTRRAISIRIRWIVNKISELENHEIRLERNRRKYALDAEYRRHKREQNRASYHHKRI